MNAARFEYKEITEIILRSFKAENQNSKDLYMIIKEKISVMISVDRRLSGYETDLSGLSKGTDGHAADFFTEGLAFLYQSFPIFFVNDFQPGETGQTGFL